MATKRWKRSLTSVHNIGYHLIWCPKYRRPVLVGKVEERLKELLRLKAREIEVSIDVMEVMPDHVHLFVTCDPTAAPHWVVKQFKGLTSRRLRQEFQELRSRIPTLWTRSYFVHSVGHISESVVKKYIESQKGA
jgi:putative transposase